MNFINSKKGLALAGVIVGLGMVLLAYFGNPANMAMCAACFIRDVAGSLKLHTTETVQYFRPEIVGLIVGAFLIAVATKEFRSTTATSPMTRFALGFIMMIGALIFLGCPLRLILRMAAGDLTAWIGLIGMVGGVVTGALFLKKGYSLGREQETTKMAGGVLPVIMVLLLAISLFTTVLASSVKGPGSMHAPALLALSVALVVGALSQKVRICFAGSIRNAIFARNIDMLLPIIMIFVVMLVYNLATGNFKLSIEGQPIAHAQHLWNILGLYAVGFAATLAGGCPYRQMTLAGQGSGNGAVTFIGMIVGAAFAHNFGLAAAAASAATADAPAVAGGPSVAGQIVLLCCIAVLFVIGFANLKKRGEAKDASEAETSVVAEKAASAVACAAEKAGA